MNRRDSSDVLAVIRVFAYGKSASLLPGAINFCSLGTDLKNLVVKWFAQINYGQRERTIQFMVIINGNGRGSFVLSRSSDRW